MIDNIVNTNPDEVLDLIKGELFTYLSLLGVLPSYWLYKTSIRLFEKPASGLFSGLKRIAFLLFLAVLVIFCFSKLQTLIP